MLMTVEHLRKFVDTETPDELLAEHLAALEAAIRQETHNTFTERGFRHVTAIQGGVMLTPSLRILTGDTVGAWTFCGTSLAGRGRTPPTGRELHRKPSAGIA